MARLVNKQSFIAEVSAIPGGEKIRQCMQCGTCTASCPNALKMEYSPAQLIAMIRAGLNKEVLSTSSMWYCLSCYMCTVRCPKGIKPTEIMHILEYLAERQGLTNRRTFTPAMYRTFNDLVYRRGNIPEVELMGKYLLKTNPWQAVGMTSVALGLLRHGRLNLKSRKLSASGTRQLQAILDKAETLEGRL